MISMHLSYPNENKPIVTLRSIPTVSRPSNVAVLPTNHFDEKKKMKKKKMKMKRANGSSNCIPMPFRRRNAVSGARIQTTSQRRRVKSEMSKTLERKGRRGEGRG